MTSSTKRCPRCGETKDRATAFGRRKNGYSRAHCRDCERAYTVGWNQRNPEKVAASNRRNSLRRYFGLTEQQYNAMAEAQGGACLICRIPAAEAPKGRLVVDHCHITGRIRGLLCGRCNAGIGMLGDDPERLRAAIAYLSTPVIAGPTLHAVPAMPSGQGRAYGRKIEETTP